MKNGKLKAFKVMTTAALTSMIFSSFVFAENNDTTSQTEDAIVEQGASLLVKNKIETAQEDSIYKDVKKEDPAKNYKPDELVHLIVELEQPEENERTTDEIKRALFKQKQDKVIEQISNGKNSKSNASMKVKHRYFEGFNGFSVETEYQNLKDIQSIPGVAHVQVARTFQESMAASKELVQAQKVWEQYGYKGEGLVVAVVDSGIDYTHKDMTLSDAAKAKEKWTQDKINQKTAQTDVNEIWYSDKVPTGYDWADNDTDVIPGLKGSSHGTHVSGTIGANGDETKNGVAGIAPGVQLLAEKVFSDVNPGGAYEDDIIAGIEHAITLDADVINMSLGVDAGYVDEEYDPIQKAIRMATEQGTLVVVAAGNSAYSTKNNLTKISLKPFAENPDIGTVGAPGVSPFALSVASYENTKMHLNAISDGNGLTVPFRDQTQFGPTYNFEISKNLLPNTNYDMVFVGEGKKTTDYPKGKTGYIAVVKLLNMYSTVSSIQFTAKSAGVKAIIMIPPTGYPDYLSLPVTPVAVPTAPTSIAAGDALLAKMNSLPSGQYLSMKNVGDYWVDNPAKNTMSYFSSMGTTHTLDFKPEISAPGGNIYSTVPGNNYEVMSGTSMATPHVAGGSALLLQALYQKGLTHSEDTVLKSKIALMNTSKVVMDPRTNSEIQYSPRVQGSGLMQIQNAINTPVIVTNINAPLEQAGSVALKEIGQNTSFKLQMQAFDAPKGKNNSDDIEYNVYVDLLKDKTEMRDFDFDGDGKVEPKEYLSLTSERINGATVTVNDNTVTDKTGSLVKIKPGQTKMLTVNVSLPDSIKKNSFVEGFVRLVPVTKDQDKAVPLTVPYMGFYGKWDEPRNIDVPAWDKDAFVGYTALWNDDQDSPLGFNGNGFDLNHIAYSPNYVGATGIFGSFQALRNLEKVETYIEDSSGNLLKNLGDFSEYTGIGQPWKFRKNIMSFGDTMYQGYKWDMKDQSGQDVPDGEYQYVLKTTMDYPNAKPQIVKMPMLVDSIGPKVSDIKITPNNGKYEISFNAEDNASDFNSAVVFVNGKSYSLPQEQKSFLVNIEPKGIVILGVDYAGNVSWTTWGDQSFNTQSMVIQTIAVLTSTNINKSNPAKIVSWAHNRVDWTINVKDATGKLIDSWQVKNEHTLKEQWAPQADVPNGTYFITADIVTKDGFKVTTTPKQVTVVQQP
ncbi:S8 family serine peptidase [Priestia megaterium]|uniref:S8 family serine peptidase n=1 Tax=Priestia megaterium TaxID=1404 RepID=A0A6H1P2N8_PRIMG|nr:S8 family serine peptidase [Priestia megaterium]QIZ07725.1 S8 family serine peptidase [Priestia megaterium]